MKKLFRCIVWLFPAIVLFAGCNRFQERPADFVAYNTTNDPVSVAVNAGVKRDIGPNRFLAFTETVDIPTPRYNQGVTSSSLDRETDVSIVFTNERTKQLSRPTLCPAGPKLKTHIWFDGSYVYCQAPPPYFSLVPQYGSQQ